MSKTPWYTRGKIGEWVRDQIHTCIHAGYEDWESLIDVLNEKGLNDSEILSIIWEERRKSA
jgi:hypothetical protein